MVMVVLWVLVCERRESRHIHGYTCPGGGLRSGGGMHACTYNRTHPNPLAQPPSTTSTQAYIQTHTSSLHL